jgi:mono/diheme cytochrome c family protein
MKCLIGFGLSLGFLLAGSAVAAQPGAAEYNLSCAACHQINGQGVPRAFPTLVGAPFVSGDPKAVIYLVLRGRAGMPPFAADLSDADVAAIVGYVRASWGNEGGPVTADDVAAVRAAVAKAPPTH